MMGEMKPDVAAFKRYVLKLEGYSDAELAGGELDRLFTFRWPTTDDTISRAIAAARTPPTTQGAGEPWSWDMIAAPQAAQVAFTNSLGMNAVAVCVRKGRGGLDRIGNHVSIASGWAIDGEETLIEDRGWRAYAWRKVEIPPPAAPPAPASDHVGEKPISSDIPTIERFARAHFPKASAGQVGNFARDLYGSLNASANQIAALVGEAREMIEQDWTRNNIAGLRDLITRLAAALHPSAEGGADKT